MPKKPTDTISSWLAAAIIVGLGFLVAPAAYAALKVWSTGEIIRTTDLNGNFSQVNTAASGLVTDSKVASNAAISSCKLNAASLVPVAWGFLSAACNGAAGAGTNCTVAAQVGLLTSGGETGVDSTGTTGRYTVKFATTRVDTNYAAHVQPFTASGAAGTILPQCWVVDQTAADFTVQCRQYEAAGDTSPDTNLGFSLIVLDQQAPACP